MLSCIDSSNEVGNMKKNIFVITVVVGLLVGCSSAQRSSEVNAVYVPADQYKSMSCEELSSKQKNSEKEPLRLLKQLMMQENQTS